MQEKQNDNTMKTIILNIGSGATSGILKAIREENIKHNYLGIDQNNQLLMQLCYPESQQPLIDAMNVHMKEVEAISAAINAVLQPIFEQQKREEDLAWLKLKYKFRNARKALTFSTKETKTTKENGNEKGE